MTRPHVYGTPGGSLKHSKPWAVNQTVAQIGQNGEQQTAKILNQLAATHPGMTVIHDIITPGLNPKYVVNIDHLVISGQRLLLLDSKVWQPGQYWTILGKSHRGLTPTPHLDKKTMLMSRNGLSDWLRDTARLHVQPRNIHTLVAAWPSNNHKPLHVTFAHMPGARIIHAQKLAPWLTRHGWCHPADPFLEAALAGLANQQ